MKTVLIAVAVSLLALTSFAQTFTAPVQPQRPTRPAAPPPITARQVDGVIPRAVRGGNPAQMLNPAAPPRYGTAEQHVLLKPDGSGKWNGIRLFAINF